MLDTSDFAVFKVYYKNGIKGTILRHYRNQGGTIPLPK